METHPRSDLNRRKSSNNVEELGRMLDENIESLMAEDAENIEVADNTINSVGSTSNIETTDSPEVKKSPNKKTLLSIGGVALALTITAATFFGIGTSKRSSESNAPTQESTAPSIKPSATESMIITSANTITPSQTTKSIETTSTNTAETINNFKLAAENVVEGYLFNTLNQEQKIEIKKLGAMTLEAFRKLPEDKQLMFAHWICETNKGRAEHILKANEINAYYTEKPKTPDDYLRNYIYLIAFASTLETKQRDYDDLTAKKIECYFLRPSFELNGKWDRLIDGAKETGYTLRTLAKLTDYKYTNDGIIIGVHEESSKTSKVTVPDYQLYFQPTKFISIRGETVDISRLTTLIPKNDIRYIPDLGNKIS